MGVIRQRSDDELSWLAAPSGWGISYTSRQQIHGKGVMNTSVKMNCVPRPVSKASSKRTTH